MVPAKQTISQRPAIDSAGIRYGVMVFLSYRTPRNAPTALGIPEGRDSNFFNSDGQQSQGNAYSWSATSWNVAEAFEPIEVIAPKQTTTIKANITAYSTAVGPSSDFRKRCTFEAKFFIASLQMRDHP